MWHGIRRTKRKADRVPVRWDGGDRVGSCEPLFGISRGVEGVRVLFVDSSEDLAQARRICLNSADMDFDFSAGETCGKRTLNLSFKLLEKKTQKEW